MRLKTGQIKRLFQYDLPASQVCKDLLEMMGPRKIILPRYIVLYQGKARTQKRLT